MKKLSFVLALSLLGCATDDPAGPELLPGFELPPVPDNGMQIVTPIVRDLQPGSDSEICTWTDAFADRDLDIRSAAGFQPEPGHHIVVYYTTITQPPGTQRECTDNDMASFRYVAGTGEKIVSEAPGALVYRIPKGAQIVLNHHYLNASDHAQNGQAAVNLNYAEPGRTYTRSGSLAVLDTSFELGAGIQELDIRCTMDRELKLWFLMPHMHRWGKNIKVDILRNDTATRMFDTDWVDEYTFHPPEKRMDPATPLVLSPGDQVGIHCTWNNDTGTVLTFGFEMCVAFAQFVDDQEIGGWTCNKGEWDPL